MVDGEQVSPHKGKRGLHRLAASLVNSLAGLRAALRHEDAFRQECLAALVLMPVALLSGASGVGKALLVGSVLLVLMVELLNSAIEATVDRISLEDNRLAGRAKDMASAAVLISLVNVAVTWLLVLTG